MHAETLQTNHPCKKTSWSCLLESSIHISYRMAHKSNKTKWSEQCSSPPEKEDDTVLWERPLRTNMAFRVSWQWRSLVNIWTKPISIYVAQSTLENTGLGLFLLPLRSGVCKPCSKRPFCCWQLVFSCTNRSEAESDISRQKSLHCIDTDKSQPGNYYVYREGVSYDAEVIDGENHGQFANQGSH